MLVTGFRRIAVGKNPVLADPGRIGILPGAAGKLYFFPLPSSLTVHHSLPSTSVISSRQP